jgi:hypothetical protein
MLLSSIVALSPAPRIVHRASPIVASESLAVTTSKAAIGLAAVPVTWASLATLATTGCGLRGELAGTAEGVAYVVVAGFAATTAYTRITSGTGLAEAECAAAESEMAVLEAAGASDEQKRLSAEKAAALADGPANLLLAGDLAVLSAVAALLVFGGRFVADGALPSALPSAGGACWS